MSVERQSLDLGGKWHPALSKGQSLMSTAVLENEHGGTGAERYPLGGSRGERSESALSSRFY